MKSPAEVKRLDVEALRAGYPVLSRKIEGKTLVYLDSACTALKSQRVAQRLARFYAEEGGCGGKRSTHLLSQRVEESFAAARRAAARFLGADGDNEIVFTSGTTDAANLVARSFQYVPGRREVVISDLEHNAVALPFIDAAARGEIELKICPTDDGVLDLDRLSGMITKKTALLALTHASNVMGGVVPVAQAALLARRAGARVFVDDAQYLGTHDEDVAALGADFVAFSAHKLGGPFGLGVLWGREQALNGLRRFKVGGGTLKNLQLSGRGAPEVSYLDAPMRFEAGVQNFGGAIGLHEALTERAERPAEAVCAHVSALVRRLAAGLARFSAVRVLGRPAQLEEGALVSFLPRHPNFSPVDFNLYLNHELPGRFVAVRVGEHCAHLLHRRLNADSTVRASLGAYNTAAEVDLFIDAVGSYAAEACGEN
jgi:cysteine desulfurase/selenocysteine lyase